MSWYRWLVCAFCVAVADGAWLYPLLGLIGFIAGLGHAPVGFAALQGVLLAGVCSVAQRDLLSAHPAGARVAASVLAAGSIWLAVAASGARVGVEAGLGWPLRLLPGAAFDPARGAALVTLMALLAWCWRHARRRAAGGVSAATLARGFRAGLVVLVVVLAFESAGGLDLGTRAALVPFFLASLFGMALARAPAHGERARTWMVLVAAVSVAVVAGGLVLGTGLVLVLRGGFGALWAVWSRLAGAASRSVGDALHALLGDADGSAGTSGMLLSEPMEAPQWFVLLILLLGAALMSWAAGRVLRSPSRPVARVVMDLGEEQRESLDAADTPAVGRWRDVLSASWWPRRSRHPAAAQAEREQDGIARIHALYSDLLHLAGREGVALNRADTPFQRAPALSRALPGAPVDELTARFVEARYGALEPPPAVVADLVRKLQQRA